MRKVTTIQKIFPILSWLPVYKKAYLKNDVFSGLTVGVLLIPQGMAYAMIAGLPPVFGLYASLLPQIIYALTGTSRQLAVGPVAMDSLLVAAGLGALSITGVENYIAMAILLAFMMGAIQLLLGVFKMGFIVNFLSKPVISGFTSAAAIIIALSQLQHLIGVPIQRSNQIHLLLTDAINKISQTNIYTLFIGLVGIIILILLKKIAPKFPRALFVVGLGIGAVMLLKLNSKGVSIVGSVPSGLPAFSVPSVSVQNMQELFPIAATLALVAFMEAISISKAVQEKHDDYEVNPNQELVALGLSNIVGSFFQSYPTTGGFSRTAVNDQSGAKTSISALVAAAVVALTLLFLTSLFFHLPHAVLASIIMVAVLGLIDLKLPIRLLKTQKAEFGLLLLTFLSTLFIGIKEGIIIGVFSSLLFTLYRLSKPHVAVLGQIENTEYFRNVDRFSEEVVIHDDVLIIRFDSPLFFGNTDFFKNKILNEINTAERQIQHLIIDAESMSYIDSSGLSTLMRLVENLENINIKIYLTNVIGPVRDVLHKTSVAEAFQDRMFVDIKDAVSYIGGNEMPNEYLKNIARQTQFE